MSRNIVLLSDGTGNSAAKVWRTNVWRTFEALDLSGNDQVAFYDDGVGSSTFKPRAILGGAFGFAMFNRIILAALMLAISTAGSAAKDEPTKEECPTLDHQEIEDLLRKAPSCQRAGALFEICQFGASGDVSLGAIVTEKCEGDFLSKLNAAQRRAYDREQKRCQRKYAHEDGTM